MKNYYEEYSIENGVKRVVYKSCCPCGKPYVFAEIKNGVAIFSKEFKRIRDALAYASATE